MTEKEKLIFDIIKKSSESLITVEREQENQIKDIRENGYGEIHPNNQESVLNGLNYTHGYTVGHRCLSEEIMSLLNMTSEEIIELNKENERIKLENKKYIDNLFNNIKND